jgi:hypothetical protein
MTTNIKAVLVDLRKEAHVPINRMFQALYLEIVKTTPRATGAASRAWTKPAPVSPDDFSTVITTNRLLYIERFEGGWSKQAPDGFIQPSIDKIVRRYNK